METNPRIQLPALQHAIALTFSRDGIGETDVDDENLCRFINSVLTERTPAAPTVHTNLGRGVGTSVDTAGDVDSDKDPWKLLTPSGT